MLAEGILVDVARAINDTAYARWTKDELVGYLNDGQRAIAMARPDAVSKRVTLPLGNGAGQTIPSDGERFLRLIRNMGADGATPGAAITYQDIDQLARGDPSWISATAAASIKHYLFDPADPTRYYVWPPGIQASFFAERIPYPAVEAILPGGSLLRIAWRPDGAFIAVPTSSAGKAFVYPFANGRLGTPIIPATIFGGNILAMAWSPDGAYLAVAGSTSGGVNVRIYAFNGTTLSDPAGTPTAAAGTANVIDLHWHPAGAFLAMATDDGTAGSAFVNVFPVTAGSFGAKWADPVPAPTAASRTVRFSPNGDFLAVGGVVAAALNLTVYPIANAGFGTSAVQVLAGAAGSNVNAARWTADQKFLLCGYTSGSKQSAIPWTGAAFGVEIDGPNDTGDCVSLDLSPDGTYIAAGIFGGGLAVKTWDGAAIGAAVKPTDTTATETIYGIAWHPTGLWLAAMSITRPGLIIYGRAAWAELLYARYAVPVPLSTDTPAYAPTTSAIDVPDIYRPALIAYCCHRALQKEDEAASLERATGFMTLFGQMLGLKTEKDNAISPATKPPRVP